MSRWCHDVKEAQLVGYEESLEKNNWWLSQMESVWYYGYDKTTITNKEDMYGSLTPEDITYAAEKYSQRCKLNGNHSLSGNRGVIFYHTVFSLGGVIEYRLQISE